MFWMKVVFILVFCEYDFFKRKNLLVYVGFFFFKYIIKKIIRVNKMLENVVLFWGISDYINVLF